MSLTTNVASILDLMAASIQRSEEVVEVTTPIRSALNTDVRNKLSNMENALDQLGISVAYMVRTVVKEDLNLLGTRIAQLEKRMAEQENEIRRLSERGAGSIDTR